MTENIEFCQKMLQSKPEEVVEVLKSKGFDFTYDEIVEFGKALAAEFKRNENAQGGELSEEDLGKVAGGGVWDGVGWFVASQAVGWGYYALVAFCW